MAEQGASSKTSACGFGATGPCAWSSARPSAGRATVVLPRRLGVNDGSGGTYSEPSSGDPQQLLDELRAQVAATEAAMAAERMRTGDLRSREISGPGLIRGHTLEGTTGRCRRSCLSGSSGIRTVSGRTPDKVHLP